MFSFHIVPLLKIEPAGLFDPTAALLEQLRVPYNYIPAISNLSGELITPPPSDCRFPLSYKWYAQISFHVPPSLTEQLFVLSEDKHSEELVAQIVAVIIDPPLTGHTEESFHSLWDSFITRTI